MKRKEILMILFTALATVVVMTGSAQPQASNGTKVSPEQIAKRSSERMAKNLELSDEQKSKIYQLNLEYTQERQAKVAQMKQERVQMKQMQKAHLKDIISLLDDDQIVELVLRGDRGGKNHQRHCKPYEKRRGHVERRQQGNKHLKRVGECCEHK